MAKKRLSPVFQYNSKDFDPPAPVLEVFLSSPMPKRKVIKITALLDSGADITAIPQKTVQQLQLKYVDEILCVDYNEISQKELVYSAKITFDGLGDFIIRVIASGSEYALVGRDILNKWSLFLNGQNKTFKIN